MNSKDRCFSNVGLLSYSNSDYYESFSPGLQGRHRSIVVPLPLSEDININKIENVPEKISLPVKPKEDILEKARPDEEQKKIFKENDLKRSHVDIDAAESLRKTTLGRPTKSKRGKKSKISAANFSFY